jgi:CheY-like chemotaxis protein
VKEIVQETYQILLGMKKSSNPKIEVLLDIPPNDSSNELMHGDALAIKQIILNLAGNAIKFTKEGKVTIGLTIEGHNLKNLLYKLWIEDTGPGLTTSQIEKMWKVKNALHSPNHTKIKCTGLGLSITQDLVREMDGTINTESTVGQGTKITIHFSLPKAIRVAEYEKKTATETTSTELIHPESLQSQPCLPTSKKALLAIEDNPINLQILTKFFKDNTEYSLTTVDNGVAGIKILEAQHFDAILLDQEMPNGLSGEETAKIIMALEDPKKNSTPIIFTSASVDTAWKKDFSENKRISFISKPYSRKDILSAIKKTIALSETHATPNPSSALPAFELSKQVDSPLAQASTPESGVKPKIG